MKILSASEMEQLESLGLFGSKVDCALSIASMVAAVAGAAALTTVTGGAAAIFAIGWLGGGVGVASSCSEVLQDLKK